MIAVDTNVLVRVLVDDPGNREQVAAARSRVRAAGQVFVPQVVQAETVWVLDGAYGFDKKQIIAALEALARNAAYRLQAADTFEAALHEFREGPADFADYLILVESRAEQCELVTFDRRLLRAEQTSAV